MDEPRLEIHIREEDPLFGHAIELANEVAAAMVFHVMQPAGNQTFSAPTLSAVVDEISNYPDATLLGMFVVAVGRCAKNMTYALAQERGCSVESVLEEFLPQPSM